MIKEESRQTERHEETLAALRLVNHAWREYATEKAQTLDQPQNRPKKRPLQTLSKMVLPTQTRSDPVTRWNGEY